MQSLSRLSTLPRGNSGALSGGLVRNVQMLSQISSPNVPKDPSGMEVVALANKPIIDKKATVYAEILSSLNEARARGLPFKVR